MSEQVVVCRTSNRTLEYWHDPSEDDSEEPDCRLGGRERLTFEAVDKETLPEDVEQCTFCAGEDERHSGNSEMVQTLEDPSFGPEDLGLSPMEAER